MRVFCKLGRSKSKTVTHPDYTARDEYNPESMRAVTATGVKIYIKKDIEERKKWLSSGGEERRGVRERSPDRLQ